MRPLGPAEGHILTASAGSGTGSRAGASVSLLVEERLGPGLYRATGGGSSFILRSKAELAPGSLVTARLPAGAGGPGPGAAPASPAFLPEGALPGGALLSRLGLPDDGASRLALAALLAEGARAEGPALRRVRNAALRGAPGEEAFRAELAARLEAKGLGATEAAVEALGDALSGRGGSAEGGSAGGRHRGGSGGEAGGFGRGADADAGADAAADLGRGAAGRAEAGPRAAELERGFTREVDEEGLPALLGALLRGLAQRSSPEAGVLGLFNHARGPEGSWIALPFRFSLDAVDFAGSLRILLPYIVGGPGRLEARFFAAREGGPASAWGFDLSFGGGLRPALLLRAGGRRKEAERLLPGLAEALAASGCSVRLADGEGSDPRPEGRIDLGA